MEGSSLDELKRVSANELDIETYQNSQNLTSNHLAQPELRLIHQDHVSLENPNKNGVQKHIHVVVKNLNFIVELGSNVDLTRCTPMECKLLYDIDKEKMDKSDEAKAEVAYVKSQPLEYKVNIGEGGLKAVAELKIKVLTSQHEDMLFRVKFSTVDSATNYEFHVYTEAIKVISKMTQVTKKKEATVTPMKKRTTNDMIAMTLEKLEKQQYEHSKALDMIKGAIIDNHLPQLASTLSSEFESSLRSFITAYSKLTEEEKTDKISTFIQTLPIKESEKLYEFLEVVESSPKKQKIDSAQV